ncbi:CD209 antigen-like protein E [Sparus aurata]|uniref:CD209 antigen-like protein E n=1 Tax=Sparus aurata TaxID=8175 RepID=UPI0011C16BC2|nr:CD209 antigen-like protein E [Sparus aurata]
MSTDISAKPDLSKKVRYTRKEERQENEVDIQESTDNTGNHHFQSHDGGPQNDKQPPAVQRRQFGSAVFCLGVLCFLMLTAIIVLSRYCQLKTRYDKLSDSYTQLQEMVSDITVNNSRLQDEVKKLKDRIQGMSCPGGWTRFGCSGYFRSNEKRTWYESRTDCQNKGADLVVINNKDENNFVSDLNNMNEESWIGLKTESTGRSSYKWKWVDGSPLTETVQAPGLQRASSDHYAASCNQQGQWIQSYYGNMKHYICEKCVSSIL